MSEPQGVDPAMLEAAVARLDDADAVALMARLAEPLRLSAPVNTQTKRAFAMLKAGQEADAELLDALEALRDELDDEYFELDAANDEEAPAIFSQARAVGALVMAHKSLFAEALYEATKAVEEPADLLRELGLGNDLSL